MRKGLAFSLLILAASAARADSQPVQNKWSATLYGFAEYDAISDTTQSLNDLPGNSAIAKSGYAAEHGRLTMGVRNSRIGFKFTSPELPNGLRASGLIETDFFGAPNGLSGAPNGGSGTASPSEGSVFTSPGLRVRHAWVKLQTPVLDVLAGQNWELIGWQPYFHPNTVEIQGVPGQVYSRSPQLRLSRMFTSDDVSLEVAVAASRPPERDAQMPDGQAGVRLVINNWKGAHTAGSTGTAIDGMMFGASGMVRKIELAQFKASNPAATSSTAGYGVSLDGFIPVIPAKDNDRSNSLSLNGSYVRGAGTADIYTGLTGGIGAPNPQVTYAGGPTTMDAGIVGFDSKGDLTAIQWRSFMVGAQYYLPGGGNFWVSANYSQMNSDNIADLAANTGSKAANVFQRSRWADANLFWDVTPAVRFGAEYAWFEQTYGDGASAHNNRYQFSAFYLF